LIHKNLFPRFFPRREPGIFLEMENGKWKMESGKWKVKFKHRRVGELPTAAVLV